MNGETLFVGDIPWQNSRDGHSPMTLAGAHHNIPHDYAHSSQLNAMAGFNGSFSQQFHPPPGHSSGTTYDRHKHQLPYPAQSLQEGHSMSQGFNVYQPLAYPTPYASNATPNTGPPYQLPRASLALSYSFGMFPQQPSGYQVPSTQFSPDSGAIAPGRSTCNMCQYHLTASPSSALHTPSPVIPRGPPRKPKRSGHAIWVGNIPAGASIEALKDHFAKDAAADIESVFLMGKSNCAFINYQTEDACLAAIDRFNDSLFGSVRLLCRLRRDHSSRNASSSPGEFSRGPGRRETITPSTENTNDETTETVNELADLAITEDEPHDATGMPIHQPADQLTPRQDTRPGERYFIVKSLTKEDLQDSLQKGTWETQPHNQSVFAQAYRACSNVYLIFSVNKSGEYFGYARMTSSPFDNIEGTMVSSTAFPSVPRQHVRSALKVVRTKATATAPKGFVIEDPTRGTLFWEAEHDLNSIVSSDASSSSGPTAEYQPHVYSRPFRVEWLSVRKVAFYRTKGIRNPWNSNKEVKVARDGTELETEVGRRLVSLFHGQHEDFAAARRAR